MHFDEKAILSKLQINTAERKSFVFDLDGTLIYNGKPLEPHFENVLLEIQKAGHEIIFATGRSFRDFVPIVPKWCTDQPSVLFGGGLVLSGGEVKHQHLLDHEVLEEIVRHLEDNKVNYLVDGHADYYHPQSEHWLYDDVLKISGKPMAPNLEHVMAEGVYKVIVLDEKWLGFFNEFIKTRNLTLKYHFYGKCFDILPREVNKFKGLSELILPRDKNNMFVFGNDQNDLELMQEISNSIMFGGHEELKEHAKLRIDYDDNLFANFAQIIKTILKK